MVKKIIRKKKKNSAGKRKRNSKSKRRSFGRIIIKYFLLLITFLLLGSFLQVLLLKWIPPFFSSFMLIHKTELLLSGKSSEIHYKWRSYEEISKFFPLAVIAAEDQRFPEHFGFDFKAIETAIKDNQNGARIRGGSTISQQVAKNLFCWPQRNYLRKAIESYYTVLIELLWNKKRILEVYINIAELGPQIYGVESAANFYFKKSASGLTRDEAALLAAVLPSPRRYSAINPTPYMVNRREWIKKQMYQLGDKKYLKQL